MERPDANGRLTTDDRPRLLIVIASTRPGRVGLPVGQWVTEEARKQGGFEVDAADLAEVDLPLMDEPNHPRLRQYTQEHTKAWSRRADAVDAFVFVMPEYNHGYDAPLTSAIDYLVQSLKPILSGLKMAPLPEVVPIPWVSSQIDDEGRFDATEQNDEAARGMFEEIGRWVTALRALRPSLAPV